MAALTSHEARREAAQVDADSASTSWLPTALGVAGLATASMAITVMSAAPLQGPATNGNSYYYLLALSGVFYAGVAELAAAVWVMSDPRARAAAAGRRLVYASLVPLTAAAGPAVATLFR